MTKLLYSVGEGAEQLGLGSSSMWELVRRGDVESVKVGRLRKIPHDALVVFVERLRAEQSTGSS